MRYGNAGPIIDVGLLHRTHGLVDCCKQFDVPKTEVLKTKDLAARFVEDAESTVEGSSSSASRSLSLTSEDVDVPQESLGLETIDIGRGTRLQGMHTRIAVEPCPQPEAFDASAIASAVEAFATHAEDLATNVFASLDFLSNCSSQPGGGKSRKPLPPLSEIKEVRFSTPQVNRPMVYTECTPRTPCAPRTPTTKQEEVAFFSDACTPTAKRENAFLEDELDEGVNASALAQAAIAAQEYESKFPAEARLLVCKSNSPVFPSGWGRPSVEKIQHGPQSFSI